ncbi:glycosyltransferase 87 family protein [Gloeothece citriformis]|nr:glycosyltransferase 87 family protein [Gloeothece citriformis]
MEFPQNQTLTKFVKFLLITAGVITFFAFLIDLKNTLTYWGSDLRNRIVGARLLIEGMNPYFFQWHQGISEKLLDPQDSLKSITTRVSVTPTVLTIHSMIAGLSFLNQKLIWLLVQWGAFLSTVLIFYKTNSKFIKKILILIIGWFFANSFFWRYHVNAGQMYVIYVFLVSLALFVLHQNFKYHENLSGFILGLTMSLRPPFILFFIPFLIYRKWKLLFSVITGLLFGVLIPFVFMNFSIWKSYFFAVTGMTQVINPSSSMPSTNNAIPQTAINYPKIIEGMNFRLIPKHWGFPDSSLQNLLTMLNIDIPSKLLIISAVFMILLLSFLFFVKWIKIFSINRVFLAVMVLYLISEFLIPIPRYAYYDIQWILPLFIIVEESNTSNLLSNKLIMVLLVGLLLGLGSFNWMYGAFYLSIFLISFYVIVTSIIVIKEKGKYQIQGE